MTPASDVQDPVLARRGGRDALSLALLHARNELLSRLAGSPTESHLRLAARAGWFQEWWTSRHVQRARGESAELHAPRIAGIEPRVDAWLDLSRPAPPADELRHYLGEALESMLELLDKADETDDGLYVYRLVLHHDDRIAEVIGRELPALAPPPRPERDPLLLPAQRCRLGSERWGDATRAGARREAAGYVPHNERWAHEVAVPSFEIDAQCVNWAQVAEFAEDGGYDRRELWSDAGWRWLQREGRRAPRGVEQLKGGVLLMRRGALQRAPLQQAASSLTRHEAEAWCRWAGRRLPTEPEWELAAEVASRRGFAWGDGLEWVAGTARLWPGAGPLPPGTLDPLWQGEPVAGVLRGATAATPARARHPKARRFAGLEDDSMPTVFRSCAI